MLLDDKWGVHEELAAVSELYNIKIQIFGSFESWDPIIWISTAEWEDIINMLFSDVHMIFWT